MSRSGIEWTEHTLNPTAGCSLVSPGCANCYAMGVAHRFSHHPKFAGLTRLTDDGRPVWTGEVRLYEAVLADVIRRKKPTRYFVNSMSDLFHPAIPVDFLIRCWEVFRDCPQHVFQILTKRGEVMQDRVQILVEMFGVLPNVWLGVSAENAVFAERRLRALSFTPAAVRFVSAEPLLEDISSALEKYVTHGLVDWVIVGCESGPKARPMNEDWARSLRDLCARYRVPFFLKQLRRDGVVVSLPELDGICYEEYPLTEEGARV